MNTIKFRTIISCETCGCAMARTKSVRVTAENKEDAIAESLEKQAKWKESLKGQNCKVCASILEEVAKESV